MKQRLFHIIFLLLIFTLFIITFSFCNESMNQPPPTNNEFDLLIDFQKGFYSDSVELYINNEIKFSEKLSTNQYTRFAQRIEIEKVTQNSNMKITLVDAGKTFEINLPEAKTLLVNNNRHTKELEIVSVNYTPFYDSLHVNDLQDLHFVPDYTYVYAAVATSPEYVILGFFKWILINDDFYKDVVGIENVFAKLFSINFNTNWFTILPWQTNFDGSIAAGDTIDLDFNLIDFQGGYVDSLCNTLMRVDVAFTDSYNNITYVTVDSLIFDCAH